MKALKSLVFVLLLLVDFVPLFAGAGELHCGVCGMTLPENAKNHIILKSKGKKEPLHVCSPSCAHKAKKYDPSLTEADVVDFDHPGKSLDGNKAFFLIKSEKIKTDMGEMAMAPYAAAFGTKEEALAAQKKYGDGKVVQGLKEAFK